MPVSEAVESLVSGLAGRPPKGNPPPPEEAKEERESPPPPPPPLLSFLGFLTGGVLERPPRPPRFPLLLEWAGASLQRK